MEKGSVAKHSYRIKQRKKYRGNPLSFIHSWDPRYKLLADENIVYDSFSRRSIHHSISVPGEVLHQLMMVIATGKARLEPPELLFRVHLGNGQGDCNPMTNAMTSNFLACTGMSWRRFSSRSPGRSEPRRHCSLPVGGPPFPQSGL